MKPQPINSPSFGIYTHTKIYHYNPHSYLKVDYGQSKKGYIQIRQDYINNQLCSKLFCLKDKANNWVQSVLKYIDNGKQWKILRSKTK